MSQEPAWFAEPPLRGLEQRFETRSRLFRQKSQYQTIEIYDTVPFGRMLVLDGAVQTTERDEFIYHEMLALVPMLTHPAPRRVAIIGGGDGGSLRRVLQFGTVEEVWQVELDPLVADTCQKYLPTISAGSFSDRRARVRFTDGARFLTEWRDAFDVILVDCTDPVGAAEVLFSEQFYLDASKALTREGILVTQSGSPWLMGDELERALDNVGKVFGLVRTYLASVPSYPGVLWSFTLASNVHDPLRVPRDELARRLDDLNVLPDYYTVDVHFASFALPRFLSERFKEPAPSATSGQAVNGLKGGRGFDLFGS